MTTREALRIALPLVEKKNPDAAQLILDILNSKNLVEKIDEVVTYRKEIGVSG